MNKNYDNILNLGYKIEFKSGRYGWANVYLTDNDERHFVSSIRSNNKTSSFMMENAPNAKENTWLDIGLADALKVAIKLKEEEKMKLLAAMPTPKKSNSIKYKI